MQRVLLSLPPSFSAACLAACMVFLFGGGPQDSDSASSVQGRQGSPSLVTTIGMVGDVTGRIAGADANVSTIMHAGVDPHLYKPTRTDVARLMDADVIFYNGLKLEGKMQDVLEKLRKRGKPIHAVASSIDAQFLLTPEGAGGHPDPHVWMDVDGWMKVVGSIRDRLAEFDTERADIYRQNAGELLTEMEALDDYVTTVIASIPERQRVLVTAHDAFNYFGRAYGIEVRGIQGLSTGSGKTVLCVHHDLRRCPTTSTGS